MSMSSVKQIWRANQVAECMQKESTRFYSPCFHALEGFISVEPAEVYRSSAY